MKTSLANLAIVLGAAFAVCGLMDTQAVQDLLPASWMLPAEDRGPHQHFRALPTVSQGHHHFPYVLLLTGLAVLVTAIVIRRRLRNTLA